MDPLPSPAAWPEDDNERLGLVQSSFLIEAAAMHGRYGVHILASRKNGTLYVGVAGNLLQRIEQHKSLAVPGFTRRYGITTLVFVETFADVNEAIAREKQLKGWNRAWKIKIIEASNPSWDDLDPTAC